MAQSARPISPHLQIYKLPLAPILSITHRMTGVIAFLGSILILIWLITLAWDASSYDFLGNIAASAPVQILMFFWSLAMVYHLFNGIRHLAWDALKGFELEEISKSGKLVIGLSLIVTILIWVTKAL